MRVKTESPKGTVKTKVCDMSGAGDFKSDDPPQKHSRYSSDALSARPDAAETKTLGGFLFPLRLYCGFGNGRGVSAQNFGKRQNRQLADFALIFYRPRFGRKIAFVVVEEFRLF